MDNNIQTFYNNEFGKLEVMLIDNKYWFPGTDCAVALGYSDPYKAIKRHTREDGWAICPVIDKIGRKQNKRFINEGNLYRLIIKSNLKTAHQFESWVFDEVLPSVRKHGAYIMPELLEELQKNTEKNAQLLKTLAREQRERISLEERHRALKTKAEQLQMENTKL